MKLRPLINGKPPPALPPTSLIALCSFKSSNRSPLCEGLDCSEKNLSISLATILFYLTWNSISFLSIGFFKGGTYFFM